MLAVISLILLTLILSFLKVSLLIWGGAFLAWALLAGFIWGFAWLPILLIPSICFFCFRMFPVRKLYLRPLIAKLQKAMPSISDTEQIALDAGSVGWERDLASGDLNWDNLFSLPKAKLSKAEKDFLQGPVEQFCKQHSAWETRCRGDLSAKEWQFLKDNRFFGMIIPKKYGGLGFSAQAQSLIIGKIASRGGDAAVTVMVPNSLGPVELLLKYGTKKQQDYLLPRLAVGKEIPCFALTGPHSGSDAATMRDVGIVCERQFKGKKTLGISLTWDKRYITLAPVASLLGLAFQLNDPNQLLGKSKQLGITLALIPTQHKGVVIGNRHFPADGAFMNGPTSGKDVFIPMDWLIGGEKQIGQGWRMLMECLAVGRAISLPSLAVAGNKHLLRVCTAYAAIRHQFNMPIGKMEGVSEALSLITNHAYGLEAMRNVSTVMLDQGQHSAVMSAILKYSTTQAMRESLNAAMDIHGGRAICDGPANYLFASYQAMPVAITVEGANILTRSLIVFGQGILRTHPWLQKEIKALELQPIDAAIKSFDVLHRGHIQDLLYKLSASFIHGASLGYLMSSNVSKYRHVKRSIQNCQQTALRYALLADVIAIMLGPQLKKRQMLAGLMSDILADLFLWSCTIKKYLDDGQDINDKPIFDMVTNAAKGRIDNNMKIILANFTSRPVAWLMTMILFPLGHWHKPNSHAASYSITKSLILPGQLRDRLTKDIYISHEATDITGRLEHALSLLNKVQPELSAIHKAIKAKILIRSLDKDIYGEAIAKKIISKTAAKKLKQAEDAINFAIKVDDFPIKHKPHLQAGPANK